MLKSCSKCLSTLSENHFYRDRSKKDGLTCYCKECDRKRSKSWKEKNYSAYRESQRADRLLKIERELRRVSEWCKANPEARAAQRARRRSRNVGEGFTGEDVKALLVKQGSRCAACERVLVKYHVDHVMPLVLGGKNEKENIQILCPSCNLSKGAKHPFSWRAGPFFKYLPA